MEARFCINCGNTEEATKIVKCDSCGKIYCMACQPSQRCDSCKESNGIFNSNYTKVGQIWNKSVD
jgi:hypothetical protein